MSGFDYHSPAWKCIRTDILERDNNTCVECGNTTGLHVHHIITVDDGGSNEYHNLVTLCRSCHKRRHTKRLPHWDSKRRKYERIATLRRWFRVSSAIFADRNKEMKRAKRYPHGAPGTLLPEWHIIKR